MHGAFYVTVPDKNTSKMKSRDLYFVSVLLCQNLFIFGSVQVQLLPFCSDKVKPEEKVSDKIEDLEKKTHVALTKDTTRMSNSNEPIRVDKKVKGWFTPHLRVYVNVPI